MQLKVQLILLLTTLLFGCNGERDLVCDDLHTLDPESKDAIELIKKCPRYTPKTETNEYINKEF